MFEQKQLIRETALPEAALKTDRSKILIACTINLLAVSTVFMTQSIFLELSESFKIDITQARFSFSIVSLFYAASFFFLGPAADKFNLPKIAATGLLLLSITVFYSSYATNFSLFIIAIAFLRCLRLPAVSVYTHGAECTKRIYRKRLISLHFILHRGRKPFFYFFRPCLAFIWLAWRYHNLFYFTVDFSVNNVDYFVERKG